MKQILITLLFCTILVQTAFSQYQVYSEKESEILVHHYQYSGNSELYIITNANSQIKSFVRIKRGKKQFGIPQQNTRLTSQDIWIVGTNMRIKTKRLLGPLNGLRSQFIIR